MAARTERSFAHLNVQTGFTPGALGTPDEYAKYAHLYKMSAGIADENSTDLWIPFETSCEQQGVTPVFGVTLYPKNVHQPRRISVYAEDERGLTSITRLLHAQRTQKDKFDVGDIAKHAERLVTIAPHISYAALLGMLDKDRLFYELSHYGDIESDIQLLQDASYTRTLRAEPVVTNRVWKAQPQRFDQFHSLTSVARKTRTQLDQASFADTDIGKNTLVYKWIREQLDQDTLFERAASFHPEGYYKSPQQMRDLIHPSSPEYILWQQGCDASDTIADNLLHKLPQAGMPAYPVPEGMTSHSLLVERVRQALPICYPDWNRMNKREKKTIIDRIGYELRTIGDRGLDDLFLIVSDLVMFGESKDIFMHGAGSSSESEVCHVLRITNVAPIPNNLPFERFLNPEGEKIPDIDFHVDAERRGEIVDYAFTHYPPQGIYPWRIATYPTWGIKGAISEVFKRFGFSQENIKQIKDALFPRRYSEDEGETVLENVPPQLIEAAVDLSRRGIYKGNISTHFSKVGFGNRRPEHVVFVHDHPRVSESKDDVEHRKELNVDFVSSYALILLKNVLKATGVDKNDIPSDDEETIREIFRAHTTGVLGIDSPYMKGVLWPYGKSTEWKTLLKKDLLLAILASRPGVTPEHREWLMEQRGKNEPFTYQHADVDAILEESYGIVVSQEQIIQLVSQVGGFSLAEAEQVRKRISKQRDIKELARYAQQFFQKAVKNGLPEQEAQLLAEQIVDFSQYGFLKGHVLESILEDAYKLMFLKLRFPETYMQEVQKLKKGYYYRTRHEDAIFEELRRLGIPL